jgi:hypothetical protein
MGRRSYNVQTVLRGLHELSKFESSCRPRFTFTLCFLHAYVVFSKVYLVQVTRGTHTVTIDNGC